MNRSAVTVVLSVLVAAACSVPETDDFGAIEVTSSSPTAESAFSTSDGWSVDLDKMLVHVTQMNVSGADEVLTASSATLVVDYAKKGPHSLLSATARKARHWERFDFEIGPAASDAELVVVGEVSEADVDRMKKDGLSILVEGSATRGAEKKTFSWAFTTDTIYSECEGGIVVPPNGTDTADITVRADVLFADDPAAPDVFRFQPFADADADADGAVTLDEIGALPTGLRDVLDASTRRLATTFRGTRKCAAAPAPEGEE